MIQLSFDLGPAEPPAPPPAPLTLERRGDHLRLTGVWADATLADARRAVAAVLGTLPPEAPVTDLFLGHTEPAAAAARRLAAPPDAGNTFAVRHGHLGGRLVARLLGLYQLGRPDLVTELDEDVPFERLAALFGHLAAHHLAAAEGPAPGELLPYGYWMLTLGSSTLYDDARWRELKDALGTGFLKGAFDDRMVTPAPQVLVEAAVMDPSGEYDWSFGVSRCLRVVDAQARALERLGLPGLPASPLASDVAVVCSRVEGAVELFAQRGAPRVDTDSGWHFGCDDPDHVHDDRSVRFATASHLAGRLPEIVQYLALPVGWVVHRDRQGWWIMAPGEDRAFLDQDALAGPPWLTPSEREEHLR